MTDERWDDPIVEEIRKLREAHAAEFDHDLHAIVRDLRARERRSGRRFVSYPPKRLPTGDYEPPAEGAA